MSGSMHCENRGELVQLQLHFVVSQNEVTQ
jgi:hypothetical protein